MIKNYFKTAWRNLWKHKLFSFINIGGLGLAIPFALLSLIQVVVVYENDNFHANKERIYRIITEVKDANGSVIKYATSPLAIGEQLKRNYPFAEQTVTVCRGYGWELESSKKKIAVNPIYAEPSFFNVFSFPLEKGNIPVEPNTLVLTHEMAEIFFADANPVGKLLSHPDYGVFTVTGVLKPYKRGTHFRSDAVVSMATYKKFANENIEKDLTAYTYVLAKENTKANTMKAALISLGTSVNSKVSATKETLHFRSQPLTKISPDKENLRDNAYTEDYADMLVNLFMAIGIILLSGFNYTNLTLARSLSRAKEVGIRKVTGALRHQLVLQFICEAVVVAFFALLLGYGLLKIMEQNLHMRWLVWEADNNVALWLVFIVFTLLTGVLAGAVPARILSGFQPVKVLKGNISPVSFGRIGFRKSLMVLQFIATCCFVFFITSYYSQFKFMATDNENFNRKNIYNIAASGDYKLLYNDVVQYKDVEQIGLVSTPFGGTSANCIIKKDNTVENVAASYYAADAEFIENMQLKFAAGDNLPNTGDSVSNLVVVNEQALYALNLGAPQEAIGKQIILNNEHAVIIHGVVKDFCYYIYQFDTQPLVMQYNPSQFHVLSIKAKEETAAASFKAALLPVWKKHFPHSQFSFTDYEDELYRRYNPGADMGFMGLVSFVIFIISMLGLIGMVTYNTEKRFKEIGIRKVLGASVSIVVKELSQGFVKLLLIAAAICLPLGYIIGYMVTNTFAFNGGVNIGLMFLLFCIVFAIAMLTVIVQAAASAVINPVKSLRTE